MPYTLLLALVIAIYAVTAAPAAAADTSSYGGRDDAMRFSDELAARHDLDAHWVRARLSQARFNAAVTRLIAPPPGTAPKDWGSYRARFVEPGRLRAGLEFWQRNRRWLDRAEERYGVPPEIIVGIVGVETFYGRQMGSFRAIDALATLAFDFPPGVRDRSAFFRDELGALFKLAHREGFDVLALKGSYAGALGMPQFMPSSWSRYAVDFDRDGRIDLHGSHADVIGSVARYLHEFGWYRGMPTHFEVSPPREAADLAALLAPDIVPSWTTEYFAERGAALSPEGQRFRYALALVELRNGDAAPSYVAGTHNFYAITRYNWSSQYAMAVIELGAAVARASRETY
jgi:membrane-bound lytic murein transglycosylase B